MTFSVVDQPCALAGQIAVDPAQRLQQSALRRILFPAAFAVEGRHDVPEALKGDLRVPGPALSDPPICAMRYTGIRWQPDAKCLPAKGLRKTFSTDACRHPGTGFPYFFRMVGLSGTQKELSA